MTNRVYWVEFKWDPTRKVWILPRVEMALELLRKHKITQRIKVLREAFCHTPEEEIYTSEEDLKLVDGKEFLKKTQFCAYCDSHFGHGGTVGIKRLNK